MTAELFRVLLVTENTDDGELVALVLERSMTDARIVRAVTALDFADQLAAGGFSAVVVDTALQWADGPAVLDAVKRRYPECAGVLLTEVGAQVEPGPEVDGFASKSSGGFLSLPGIIERAVLRATRSTEPPREIAAYDRLVEQLPIGIFATAPSGQFTAANDAVLETLGFDSVDALKQRQLPGPARP